MLAPVFDAILNQFAPEGMLTAADVEAATRRFKKALLERARSQFLATAMGPLLRS